jgi:hypothetical protein
MEAFFTWISQMTRLEAFSYIILIAFIMLVIPYATFLYKAIQKIVLWKKMKVINFVRGMVDFDVEVFGNTTLLELKKIISIKQQLNHETLKLQSLGVKI